MTTMTITMVKKLYKLLIQEQNNQCLKLHAVWEGTAFEF